MTQESNRKAPKIHIERLQTERMQTPVSRRKTPDELQTAEPINLMRQRYAANPKHSSTNINYYSPSANDKKPSNRADGESSKDGRKEVKLYVDSEEENFSDVHSKFKKKKAVNVTSKLSKEREPVPVEVKEVDSVLEFSSPKA